MRKNHFSFKIRKTNRSMLHFENCVIIRHWTFRHLENKICQTSRILSPSLPPLRAHPFRSERDVWERGRIEMILPIWSLWIFLTMQFSEGFNRMQTPLLCIDPCEKNMSPPHSLCQYFHRSVQSTSLVEKIRHNFDLFKNRKCFSCLRDFFNL